MLNNLFKNAAIVRYGFKMLNELKNILVSRVLFVLGPRSKREGERERKRGRERGGEREQARPGSLSLSLALRVEYREDPGYKVADTNWLRN